MPHTRRIDQTVEAFGISPQLLAEAKKRAHALGMTKSGYFRYAFARELGYPEGEAKEIAMFRSPTLLRRRAAIEEATGTKKTRSKVGPSVLSDEAKRAAMAAEKALMMEHLKTHPKAGKSK